MRWLHENPRVGWAYWAINPVFDLGILNDDMETVRDDWKLKELQGIQPIEKH